MKLAFAVCMGLVFFMFSVCIDQSKACASDSSRSSSSRSSYGRSSSFGSSRSRSGSSGSSSSWGRTRGRGSSQSNRGPVSGAGAGTVQDVVTQIGQSGVFPDDKGLLRRIAYVESKDGTDRNTKRPGYYGGIWQVDRAGFDDTKKVKSHPGLAKKYENIQREFGVDWPSVQWEDIRDDPLKSGLAARLVLSNKPGAIPSDVDGQAKYWKKNYNTPAGAGTVEKFKTDVGLMP